MAIDTKRQRPYATAQEIAAYMGCCEQTVWRRIRERKWPGEKDGKTYKMSLPDFEKLKARYPRSEQQPE